MSGPLDGISSKYGVTKTDGTPTDPEAKYLVVRIDGKPRNSAERAALQAYLLSLDTDDQRELADHLRAFFGVAEDPLMSMGAEL